MQVFFFLGLLLISWGQNIVGFASPEYSRLCDSVFCKVLEKSYEKMQPLKTTVDEGTCVSQFGSKADEICNSAIEEFASEAILPEDNNQDNEILYDRKVEELERLIDAPLHVLYHRQLLTLRERALRVFKQGITNDGQEYEALFQADEMFRKEAEQCTRQHPDWSYAKDAASLKASLLEIVNKAKKATEIKLQSAKQQQQSMQFLQIQQQQLQAIQQQVSGQTSPWNIGAAYRIPDTNINLSLNYQQGRANIQVSCVPDEAMSLLGPNGFVHGVTPGNIGMSFNINL